MTMQALVIAHAAYGHNSFFKGNHLFRTWTNADAIIDYLVFARDYIRDCEQRHGELEVEMVLDACHAIMDYGVDLYKRPAKLSPSRELQRQKERESYRQQQVNEIWRTLPVKDAAIDVVEEQCFPAEAEENLLYFIEKHAPMLEPWQRELVRIVRKLSQYFYPQPPDKSHERRLGLLLALRNSQLSVCARLCERRVHARVPAITHQRHAPT